MSHEPVAYSMEPKSNQTIENGQTGLVALWRVVSVWWKRHASIWWIAAPLAAIGLGLHLTVAAIHYRTNGDPWYLFIFFGIASVGAVAIWRTIRAFRPSR